MKNIHYGIIHFFSHLFVEIITFYILTSILTLQDSVLLCLLYDLLAFVPQGIYGYFLDLKIKIPFFGIGIVLLFISFLFFKFALNSILIVILLSTGNAFIHVYCAQSTIKTSEGKMSNVSLFVSGGSFGLIIGKLLKDNSFSTIIICIILLLLCGIELFNFLHKSRVFSSKTQLKFDFCKSNYDYKIVICLTVLVVAIRALIGYGIPTSWNQKTYQLILLYIFMGLGKALGGILIDLIGIKKTIIISTLVSAPFLIFGDNIMILSIIGVMFFSMTMSITLAIILSKLNNYHGVAFGLTTLGLFIGTLPIFFYRFSNLVNMFLIVIFSILSFIILMVLSKGENDDKENL